MNLHALEKWYKKNMNDKAGKKNFLRVVSTSLHILIFFLYEHVQNICLTFLGELRMEKEKKLHEKLKIRSSLKENFGKLHEIPGFPFPVIHRFQIYKYIQFIPIPGFLFAVTCSLCWAVAPSSPTLSASSIIIANSTSNVNYIWF